MLRACAELPRYCGGDMAYEQLLPVALKYLTEGVAAVTAAAADAVVAIWRTRCSR